MILDFRKQGLPFSEIAKLLNISNQRVQQPHKIAGQKIDNQNKWHAGLGRRSVNVLERLGLTDRGQIMNAISSGRLHPNRLKVRNFGWKSYIEIHRWLGMPDPKKARPPLTVCPHCGRKIG